MITLSQKGHGTLQVKLDGKIVGSIRSVAGGFQYVPKGQTEGGKVFGSVVLCKQSLETPAEEDDIEDWAHGAHAAGY